MNKNYENISAKIEKLENQNNGSGVNMSLLSVYPVGSIYMSENSTSPEELFGGTWETYGAGRTLVGVDTSQTEFATVGKIGGEKTHTLTINEMPSHDHSGSIKVGVNVDALGPVFARANSWATSFSFNDNSDYPPILLDKSGGSQSHNNLQPYITVYMWKRTA